MAFRFARFLRHTRPKFSGASKSAFLKEAVKTFDAFVHCILVLQRVADRLRESEKAHVYIDDHLNSLSM